MAYEDDKKFKALVASINSCKEQEWQGSLYLSVILSSTGLFKEAAGVTSHSALVFSLLENDESFWVAIVVPLSLMAEPKTRVDLDKGCRFIVQTCSRG